jgi:geranylgeranyl pyrophosphate synthase
MAPVFLVTLSYELALNNPLASPERRVLTAVNLSRAGLNMIAGQASDVSVSPNESDEEHLLRRYRLKSGALYAAAANAGALLCGASADCGERINDAGMYLGLSYQFLDDVADAVGDSAIVGKDTGRDIGKPTATCLFGVEGARSRSQQFQDQALDCLSSFGAEADRLRMLVTEASWAVT